MFHTRSRCLLLVAPSTRCHPIELAWEAPRGNSNGGPMRTCLLALSFIAMPLVAAAQVDRATLTGVVRDPSNAAVAGATVTITHLNTGLASSVVTSDEGIYLVVNLPPGEVIVEA